MGPRKSDYINRMIILTVIKLSSFHCVWKGGLGEVPELVIPIATFLFQHCSKRLMFKSYDMISYVNICIEEF